MIDIFLTSSFLNKNHFASDFWDHKKWSSTSSNGTPLPVLGNMSLGKMVFFVKLWSLTEAMGYLPICKMNLSPATELSVIR